MIHLERLPEPEILSRNKAKWLKSFLAKRTQNPDAGPSSRQYGHPDIRNTLAAMSYHKCFYCEIKLDAENQVDHYVEVAEEPRRAFDWENLYLSCPQCNRRKLSNSTIPVTECVDPCGLDDPAEHITFEGEIVTARNGSPKGFRTIRKYAIDRPDLNYLRLKELQRFTELWLQLHERRGNRPFTESEKEIIRRFEQPDHPFSLMFQVYLQDVTL